MMPTQMGFYSPMPYQMPQIPMTPGMTSVPMMMQSPQGASQVGARAAVSLATGQMGVDGVMQMLAPQQTQQPTNQMGPMTQHPGQIQQQDLGQQTSMNMPMGPGTQPQQHPPQWPGAGQQMTQMQQQQQQDGSGNAFHTWAQQLEQNQQQQQQQQQQPQQAGRSSYSDDRRQRYSTTEAKRGRAKLWIPEDCMTGTTQGANGTAPQIKSPKEGYAQVRYDWGGCHMQGWDTQALINSTLNWQGQPANGCRLLVVAVRPEEAEAMASNSDMNPGFSMVAMRMNPKNRGRFLHTFGRVHWDDLDEQQWQQVAASLSAFCKKHRVAMGDSWQKTMTGDMHQGMEDEEGMEARIQAEVMRRMDDMKQAEAHQQAVAAARLTGGVAPMDAEDHDTQAKKKGRSTRQKKTQDWMTPTQPERGPREWHGYTHNPMAGKATQDLLSTTATDHSSSDDGQWPRAQRGARARAQSAEPKRVAWVKGLPKASDEPPWGVPEIPRPWQLSQTEDEVPTMTQEEYLRRHAEYYERARQTMNVQHESAMHGNTLMPTPNQPVMQQPEPSSSMKQAAPRRQRSSSRQRASSDGPLPTPDKKMTKPKRKYTTRAATRAKITASKPTSVEKQLAAEAARVAIHDSEDDDDI